MIVAIGLGNIGLAIAARLAETGNDVCGVDLSADRRTEWSAQTGLTAVGSLDEVDWAHVDYVFVVVRLTGQALAVITELSTRPVPATAKVFVSTTLELDVAENLEQHKGLLNLIELPVSGGESGARAGTLTVLAGGPLDAADEAMLLATIAAHVVRFDRFGEATLAKLLNNVAAAYTATAHAQMLLLARRVGMDPQRLDDVLLTSSGGSWMGERIRALQDDLLAKDVGLLAAHLAEQGDELPVVSLAESADLVGTLQRARSLLQERQPAS